MGRSQKEKHSRVLRKKFTNHIKGLETKSVEQGRERIRREGVGRGEKGTGGKDLSTKEVYRIKGTYRKQAHKEGRENIVGVRPKNRGG